MQDSSSSEGHLPDRLIGGVLLRHAHPRHAAHGCDPDSRVPLGCGYWSGGEPHDLCARCFDAIRDSPRQAPAPDDQARFARIGIGCGGEPFVASVRSVAELEELRAALDEHDVARVLVELGPDLQVDDVRLVPTQRRTGFVAQTERGDVRAFTLQLRGLSFGPPLDPELLARIAAASGPDGVVRDATLADEYFEAMVAQSAALEQLHGGPQPIIEQGSVFPSLDVDVAPLE